MPKFSKRSLAKLETCIKPLQTLMLDVVLQYDIAVLYGHRNEAEQTDAVARKVSHASWPNSKHNSYPSLAVDIAPWPINWEDHPEFYRMAAFVLERATQLEIPIRWGGNWLIRKTSKLTDLVHFEYYKEEL